jgi:hypothetical protein
MNTQSRIPKLNSSSFDGALMWFAEMQTKGLMFHPDDDPAEMLRVCDWQRMFSDPEVSEVRFVMNELFTNLGDEVYAAAYPIVMNAYGLQLDS